MEIWHSNSTWGQRACFFLWFPAKNGKACFMVGIKTKIFRLLLIRPLSF
jgi:hypothetical protein